MKKTIIQPHKSSLGMDANVATLVIFIAMAVVGWIPYVRWFAWGVPLAFFFLEKHSGFVKFQAVQSLVLGVIWSAISLLFQIIYWATRPRLTDIFSTLNYALRGSWGIWLTLIYIVSSLFSLALIYLIVMAYGYKQVELPIIGPIAQKASSKLGTMNFGQQGANQYGQPPGQPPVYPYNQPPGQPGAYQYNQPPSQPAVYPYNQPPGQPPAGTYSQPPGQPPAGAYNQAPGQPPNQPGPGTYNPNPNTPGSNPYSQNPNQPGGNQ